MFSNSPLFFDAIIIILSNLRYHECFHLELNKTREKDVFHIFPYLLVRERRNALFFDDQIHSLFAIALITSNAGARYVAIELLRSKALIKKCTLLQSVFSNNKAQLFGANLVHTGAFV